MDDSRASLPMKLTAKTVVKLAEEGVLLHAPSAAPRYILRFHELVTLAALESADHVDATELSLKVAAEAGAQPDEIEQFLKFLTRSGRLRRGRQIPKVPVAEAVNEQAGLDHDIAQGAVKVALKLPLVLRLFQGKFQLIDHDGALMCALNPAELMAISQFVKPLEFATGLRNQQETLGGHALSEDELKRILAVLDNAGLVTTLDQVASERKAVSYKQTLKENFARQAEELDRKELLREQETGQYRTKVIPVSFGESIPAALGLVMAYAKVYNGGELEDAYDFRLDWVWDDSRAGGFAEKPAVYLFSNYLWTHEKSIAVSEKVKRLNPHCITIHGGPDTPKYPEDAKAYFAKYPHIDIVIRGEGEATAADTLDKLRSVIGQDNPDLSVLQDVEGITYRHNGEIIRNPDRARIEDLDTIPSPYAMGLFEAYRGVPRLHVTLETNRGCPYGCTFCDWGSATTSKIRKFDLDRVFGDLKWCSDMKVHSVSQADANFGVFERDVDIAQCVADLKTSTGYPEAFGGSYAKNSTKYLQKIIKVMAEAGILTQGVLSLQTMDDSTLSVIKRSNIKVEKYDALANEMRNANLQLSVELMMGLPGSTLQSFLGDLQQCIDRDIQARINHTTLLVNSPMNAPDYREAHQIVTGTELGPGKMPVLVSTKTYTRDDMTLMLALRQIYILFDNFGVLRLCARFVRQQTGMTEMEFYTKLYMDTSTFGPQYKWPLLHTVVNFGPDLMAPAPSWALFYAELRDFLVKECGVPDDSALDAILRAQHAIMPSHGRSYPYVAELPHDVVEWHKQMLTAKASGRWRDWQEVVPPLSSFGPAELPVDDSNGSVTKLLGCHIDINSNGATWDMDSGIARAKVDMDFNPAFLVQDDIIHVA